MRGTNRTPRLATVVAVATMALTACAGGAQDPTATELTIYSSLNPEVSEALLAAFEEEHPDIEVDYLRLSTGPLTVRYQQEQQAGTAVGDVVIAADRPFFEEGTREGWFAPLREANLSGLAQWPAEDVHEGTFLRVGTAPSGVSYNTNLVAPEAVPRTWQDLLDPRLRGQILLADPRNVPVNLFLLGMLRDRLGAEFTRGLAGQDLRVVESAVPGAQQLAAGEAGLLFPSIESVTDSLAAEGAPVDTVILEPTSGYEQYLAVSERTDNPDAARIFADFVTREVGQIALNEAFRGASPLGQLPGTVAQPAGYVTPDTENLTTTGAPVLADLGLPPS